LWRIQLSGWPDWANFRHRCGFNLDCEFWLLFSKKRSSRNFKKDGLGYILGDFQSPLGAFVTKGIRSPCSTSLRVDAFLLISDKTEHQKGEIWKVGVGFTTRSGLHFISFILCGYTPTRRPWCLQTFYPWIENRHIDIRLYINLG
jgi:hypothetical protein